MTFLAFFRDGSHDQFPPEEILSGALISVLAVGISVVHGFYQGKSLFGIFAGGGIQEGDHGMAQAQEAVDDFSCAVGIAVGHLGEGLVFGAVQTVYGAEYAELHKAYKQLVVLDAAHMSSDVMAPPGVSGIAGGGGEVGKVLQGLPGHHGVSREAHGIAVGADACVAGKDQLFLIFGNVKGVVVVQSPKGVVALQGGGGSLLPVNPPEVHAVLLVGLVQKGEVGVDKVVVGKIKFHLFFGGGIHAHTVRHLLILFVDILYAGSRMQVQGDVHVLFFYFAQKVSVVREKLPVPAVARPAVDIRGQIFAGVPVHIDGGYGKGNVILLELLHQLQVFPGGVGMISAPPVAQGVSGKGGRRPAQEIQCLYGAPVVQAIGEDIEILFLIFSGDDRAVIV